MFVNNGCCRMNRLCHRGNGQGRKILFTHATEISPQQLQKNCRKMLAPTKKGLTAICRKSLSHNQCGKQDLNLHPVALNLARLPIPPFPRLEALQHKV